MTGTGDQNAARDARIRELLEKELADGEDLASEARKMIGYLLLEKKGYAPEDVRKAIAIEVQLDNETAWSSLDFLVSVDGRKAMVIKCAAGSIDSRERQAVALARVIASLPLPVAVVADPVAAVVLDVASGKVTGESFGAIPTKDQLREIVGKTMQPLDPGRLEREKRILLAFDTIKCSVPQGRDGGVWIGPKPGTAKSSKA
jgi:hypothetical protein